MKQKKKLKKNCELIHEREREIGVEGLLGIFIFVFIMQVKEQLFFILKNCYSQEMTITCNKNTTK